MKGVCDELMAYNVQERLVNLAMVFSDIAKDDKIKKDPKNVNLFQTMILNDQELIDFKKVEEPDPVQGEAIQKKLNKFYEALI